MSDQAGTYPYTCSQCGAAGRLALVEGETPCPHCGARLWTLPPQAAPPPADAGLAPDYDLPLLSGRPPLCTKGLWRIRLCAVVFRPLVVLWAIWRQRTMEDRVNARLDAVAGCRRREDLERLLGRPLYAVDGKASGGPHVADRIECYESEGCCIDLWFNGDRLVDVSGFVKPSLWDMAMTRGYQDKPEE